MNTLINPSTIAPPAAAYSHAVLSSTGSRILHVSGTVGTRADGSIGATVGDQAEAVWAALREILEAADMTLADVVSYTTYAVAGQPLGEVMAARDRALAGHKPASTLITVAALARPEWLVEISAVAAAG